jgi:hypothetical protein
MFLTVIASWVLSLIQPPVWSSDCYSDFQYDRHKIVDVSAESLRICINWQENISEMFQAVNLIIYHVGSRFSIISSASIESSGCWLKDRGYLVAFWSPAPLGQHPGDFAERFWD